MKRTFSSLLLLAAMAFAGCPYAAAQSDPVVENIIETNIDYAEDIVVYQAKHTLGQASRDIICAGLFIKDESIRSDRGRIEADFLKINELLPDYKRIEYIELAESEYEKTSTRKIKRTILPQECSGKGIIL